jgi:hypothetical protein
MCLMHNVWPFTNVCSVNISPYLKGYVFETGLTRGSISII